MKRIGLVTFASFALVGCQRALEQQPRYNVYSRSEYYPDESAMRPSIPDTVARGESKVDPKLATGNADGKPLAKNPLKISHTLLVRGQARFNIYCTACHGRTGDGQGMVVKRGFTPPPSFHIDRLKETPDGHIFQVISQGYGVMSAYADRISPEDRWAIVAYVRALQFSREVPAGELDARDLSALNGGPSP